MGFSIKPTTVNTINTNVQTVETNTETIETNQETIQQSINRVLSPFDIWSDVVFVQDITAVATTFSSGPGLTIVGIPDDAVVAVARFLWKFRKISEDSGSDNSIDGDQVIQVAKRVGGSYITAFTVRTGMLACPASSVDAGDVWVGAEDIKAQVPANGAVMDMRWVLALASFSTLYLHDIQFGVRLYLAPAS